jgi:Flp pilus assembly protein TadG
MRSNRSKSETRSAVPSVSQDFRSWRDPASESFCERSRRGNVLVLASCSMAMLFAFTAFVVDVGYIVSSRGELSAAADGAALAATNELSDSVGVASTAIESAARQAAVDVAYANQAGSQSFVYLDPARDIRFGRYSWDGTQWTETWGATPWNMVEVTSHRDQVGSSVGDGPLDLFFAPVMGHDKAGVSAKSTAALLPCVSVRKIPGKNLSVLPFTIDEETWDDAVSDDSDCREINLLSTNEASGNWGAVDFGNTNNSTADLSRQIRYGLNDSDLQSLGGQIDLDAPMTLNGDTGISAGIKDDLASIVGKPLLVPLYESVSGSGNNANYQIVRMVGARITSVRLTGSHKQIIVEPATFVVPGGVAGEVEVTEGTVFCPAVIVK